MWFSFDLAPSSFSAFSLLCKSLECWIVFQNNCNTSCDRRGKVPSGETPWHVVHQVYPFPPDSSELLRLSWQFHCLVQVILLLLSVPFPMYFCGQIVDVQTRIAWSITSIHLWMVKMKASWCWELNWTCMNSSADHFQSILYCWCSFPALWFFSQGSLACAADEDVAELGAFSWCEFLI